MESPIWSSACMMVFPSGEGHAPALPGAEGSLVERDGVGRAAHGEVRRHRVVALGNRRRPLSGPRRRAPLRRAPFASGVRLPLATFLMALLSFLAGPRHGPPCRPPAGSPRGPAFESQA